MSRRHFAAIHPLPSTPAEERTRVATVSVLITVLAVLVPIGLIAGPIVWFILRRRRAAKKATPPA